MFNNQRHDGSFAQPLTIVFIDGFWC